MTGDPGPTGDDRVVAPLREARVPIYAGLSQLQAAAQAIDEAEPALALRALDTALTYLRGTLLPFCRAEEFTMFIAVEGAIGITGASDVMKAQHRSISAMVDDLARVVEAAHDQSDPRPYRRYLLPLLHGLYALVRAHLESEDDAYLALLDEQLSESQVRVIVENIQRMVAGSAAPTEHIAYPRL